MTPKVFIENMGLDVYFLDEKNPQIKQVWACCFDILSITDQWIDIINALQNHTHFG